MCLCLSTKNILHDAVPFQVLASMWEKKSNEVLYQKLFLTLGMQEELPKDILEACKVQLQALVGGPAHGPTTPRRASNKRPPPGEVTDELSPEKPRTLPKRVASARAASFGKPPSTNTSLLPAKRKDAPDSNAADVDPANDPADGFQMDSDDEEDECWVGK